MMSQAFKVETTTMALKDHKGVPVTTSLVAVQLLQHGVPVADFADVALAHRCAELLNKNGVS